MKTIFKELWQDGVCPLTWWDWESYVQSHYHLLCFSCPSLSSSSPLSPSLPPAPAQVYLSPWKYQIWSRLFSWYFGHIFWQHPTIFHLSAGMFLFLGISQDFSAAFPFPCLFSLVCQWKIFRLSSSLICILAKTSHAYLTYHTGAALLSSDLILKQFLFRPFAI